MTALVADATVVVAALTDDGDSGHLSAAALRGHDLVAPAHLQFEVAQVLRKQDLAGLVPPARVRGALVELAALGVELVGFEPLAARIWELRRNVSAYDAAYVALAELVQVPLVTLDHRLARAPGIRCEVVLPA